MNNYYYEFIKGQSELYNALIKKCVDGEQLNDIEFMFIANYERKLMKIY